MRRRLLGAVLAGLVMTACGERPDSLLNVEDVDIKASDGVLLKASYFSPRKPGPEQLHREGVSRLLARPADWTR